MQMLCAENSTYIFNWLRRGSIEQYIAGPLFEVNQAVLMCFTDFLETQRAYYRQAGGAVSQHASGAAVGACRGMFMHFNVL